MKIEIEVTEPAERKIPLSTSYGTFEEGDFKGSFAIAGATMLINCEGGKQYRVDLKQIIEVIYKQHHS